MEFGAAPPEDVTTDVPALLKQAARVLAVQVAAQVTVARALALVSARVADLLTTPVALLSRDPFGWRFEAQSFPDLISANDVIAISPEDGSELLNRLQGGSRQAWTAITLGTVADKEWMLLLPGQSENWANREGFGELVENVSRSLEQVANRELIEYDSQFQRRLHRLNLRLARATTRVQLHEIVLELVAGQVRAQTSALALYDPSEDALAIVATRGYPAPIVEHLRIRSGEGVIGRGYQSGRPLLENSSPNVARRLRYRTDSYMVLPITCGTQRFGVIALTDRSDGQRFDARDFAAARLMVAVAATAFDRERLRERLRDLTELATVDPVTQLFNRRFFEARLDAEVERARRQNQELALLLIDIDDFKRVNDTRGHLHGDHVLREVADLLRAGVRIFDVCARYGGEEFVIVMPTASVTIAQQVAERIRMRIERSFSNESPPVTISVGVGMLDSAHTADELVDIADHALIAAKRAGKNRVYTGSEPFRRQR